MTLLTQWTTMLLMVTSGCLMGFVLDVYRVLKAHFGLRGWTVSLIDLLYWIVSAGLVFSILFWSNWGDLRFYIFIAISTGFLVYMTWCSRKIISSLEWLLGVIERIINHLYHAVYHVVWIPACKLWNFFVRIFKYSYRMIKTIFYLALRPFEWVFMPVIKKGKSFIGTYIPWIYTFMNRFKKKKGD